MCRSYSFEHMYCGHLTQPEYRYCPDRFTTCQSDYFSQEEATARFCAVCYLHYPGLALASKRIPNPIPGFARGILGGDLDPAPLDVAVHGDIWERIRQSEDLNSMPLNNLDALIGMLNGGDGRGVDRFDKTWLRNTIDALDLDILYRFERPDSPMRDEREIQLLLKLQGIAFNWIMDDEDYADFDPADYDDYSDDGDDGDSDNYLDDDDEREDEIDDESDEAEFGDWYRFFGLDDDDSDGSGDFDDSDDEEDREPIPEDLQRQAIELLKPVDISTLDEDKKTCPICYEAFGPSNDPCQTLCEHTFCSDCIRKWIRTGLMCPMCRRDFVDLYVVEEMEDSAEELEAVVERLPSPWWITVLRGD